MKEAEKTSCRNAVMVELMRAAMLEREDWNLLTEEDAAVFAVWRLLNPLSIPIPSRERLELSYGPPSKSCRRIYRFTAHAHTDEPLRPSPDDMLVYDLRHQGDRRSVHYTVDRFLLRKLL